jgi:hypothetical protein
LVAYRVLLSLLANCIIDAHETKDAGSSSGNRPAATSCSQR